MGKNFSVISMLWAPGLRVSELTSLKVKSFEPDHDPAGSAVVRRIRGVN
jgi:site-specific recombinase XerD